jgi:hypothetical protein
LARAEFDVPIQLDHVSFDGDTYRLRRAVPCRAVPPDGLAMLENARHSPA